MGFNRSGLITLMLAVLAASGCQHVSPALLGGRQVETLDRGLVAAPARDGGVLVSWRAQAGDLIGARIKLTRNGQTIATPIVGEATNIVDAEGKPGDIYQLADASGSSQTRALAKGYLEIPIDPPTAVDRDGKPVAYNANDGSAADLDGDGDYEIILKWDPANSQDNAFAGFTSPTYFDAYTLEGKRLWRIDMGRNIRSGAHYTQFLVFDFDGDGRAEFVAKTADGTTDGQGKIIGDAKADWRSGQGLLPSNDRTGSTALPDGKLAAQIEGRILAGPEYLTVFDGLTGKALATTDYVPGRHPDTNAPTPDQLAAVWGDGYGNRSDRFLAGVAYLDGKHPSFIMARGYYARTTLAAFDWRGGKLTQRWFFDSTANGDPKYAGQGNHQLSVADVDGDGRDEIVYGAMALDDDGKPLWSSNLLHGDTLHVGDLDPTRPGLERFGAHEVPQRNGGIGAAMLDARTGAVIWSTPATADTGRGVAIDIDPRYPGDEAWATNSASLYDARGLEISKTRPRQVNFGIYWDGDTLRELLDQTEISEWDWETSTSRPLLTAEGVTSNNGTKATPVLQADILGDWREEVIWRTTDNRSLRIYVTPYPTTHRIVTLMLDPVYRLNVAAQNVAYNQPPHTSFAIGETK